MKKITIFLLAVALFAGCKKDKDSSQGTPPQNLSYINTANGSSWNYHVLDSSAATPQTSDYVITSTGRDTSIQGKSFHVYSNSDGGFQYLNKTGSDYNQYESIPGISDPVVQLFLKDNLNVNGTWTQNITISSDQLPAPIPVVLNNKIIEKGNRTVNGIDYRNVIHVQTGISSALLPPGALQSKIDTYYAPDCGLIESSIAIDLDYAGIIQKVNVKTTLKASDLK